jgi:hypothetical protein
MSKTQLLRIPFYQLVAIVALFSNSLIAQESVTKTEPIQPEQVAPETSVMDSQSSVIDRQLRPYSAALGLGSPDLFSLQVSYELPYRSRIVLGSSLAFPYPVTIVAPADEEVIKSRLKAGTPETDYETTIKYYRNIFANVVWHPFERKGLYALGGLGYRKMHVETNGRADLFVCLVTAEIPCNKERETFPSLSVIELSATIETVAYNFRLAGGWVYEWSNNVYLDWTIFGLVISKPVRQSIGIRSKLETEQTIEEANEILSEMESYLASKEQSIRSRVVTNVEKLDRLPLPYTALTVGYQF